jgi:hypothetical protein
MELFAVFFAAAAAVAAVFVAVAVSVTRTRAITTHGASLHYSQETTAKITLHLRMHGTGTDSKSGRSASHERPHGW